MVIIKVRLWCKYSSVMVSFYSGKFRPGQNSVKIFASQKQEDESEKFISKNSGNANYYSNESPRQVQRKCSNNLSYFTIYYVIHFFNDVILQYFEHSAAIVIMSQIVNTSTTK